MQLFSNKLLNILYIYIYTKIRWKKETIPSENCPNKQMVKSYNMSLKEKGYHDLY